MAAASAAGMTNITHLNMARNFSDKFVAFETESPYVPPSSDYYPLPSFGPTRFGYCDRECSNYAIRIKPLLKPTAKDASVSVFAESIKEEGGEIATLFRMRVASNKECTEILSALKNDNAKLAYLDKKGAMELFDPLLLYSVNCSEEERTNILSNLK